MAADEPVLDDADAVEDVGPRDGEAPPTGARRSGTIRALRIDPTARTVEEVQLPLVSMGLNDMGHVSEYQPGPPPSFTAEDIGSGLYEAGRAGVQFGRQLPGSLVAGVGTVPIAGATVQTDMDRRAQSERQWLLSAIDAIDRGEAPPRHPTPGTTGPDPRIAQYMHGSAEQRATLRSELQAEVEAFTPTPVQDRTLYRAGEWLQNTGRGLVPHLEGFDEQSISTQLSRGLGSMFVGLGASIALGPAGSVATFGSMGIGEATQRAVEFDRAERAAGRPGISQEQILTAGFLGIAPGVTDIVPVENLLGRLPIRMPPMVRSALARVIARIGGQAFIEGVQEGGQELLQDVIAKLVYNPNQVIGEEFWQSAGLGGGVGAIAEGGRQAGGGLLRAVARALRGGRSGTPQAEPSGLAPPGSPSPAPIASGRIDPDALSAVMGVHADALDYIDVPRHVSRHGDRIILNADAQARDVRGLRRDAADDVPVEGAAIIASFDPITGAWGDTRLTKEEVRSAIEFGNPALEAVRGTPQFAEARRLTEDGVGPLTTARLTGLSAEAVSLMRQELDDQRQLQSSVGSFPPALAALRDGEPIRLTPGFRSGLPAMRARLEAEFRHMLPRDVVIRLTDRVLQVGRFAADEVVSRGRPPHYSHLWALSVSLEKGEATAQIKGFHGIAAHILRGYGKGGLYTEQEWQLLVERATKEKIKEELQREPTADGSTTLWRAYEQTYAQYGPSGQRKHLEEELVGRLAEHYAAGRRYGTHVDGLLERLVKFLEALRNALRGMGFQTADDVFERVASGEVARRSNGLREPDRELTVPVLSAAPVPGARPGRREPLLGPHPAVRRQSDNVTDLAAEIRQALRGYDGEIADDIKLATSLWESGGDASLGATLAQALAATGHRTLAARVNALLRGRR